MSFTTPELRRLRADYENACQQAKNAGGHYWAPYFPSYQAQVRALYPTSCPWWVRSGICGEPLGPAELYCANHSNVGPSKP